MKTTEASIISKMKKAAILFAVLLTIACSKQNDFPEPQQINIIECGGGGVDIEPEWPAIAINLVNYEAGMNAAERILLGKILSTNRPIETDTVIREGNLLVRVSSDRWSR